MLDSDSHNATVTASFTYVWFNAVEECVPLHLCFCSSFNAVLRAVTIKMLDYGIVLTERGGENVF